MNLRQMEAFRAVMLAGTVRGAAGLLHVSEPAVSKLVTQAERRAGVRLFDRVKGRLVPTPEARTLHGEVDNLWRGVERVRDTLQLLAQPRAAHLRLSLSPSVSLLVPSVIETLYREVPELNCRISVVAPHELVAELADGSADLGVALAPPEHPSLTTAAEYHCGLVCVMPVGHPLARRRTIRAADLAGHRLLAIAATSAVLQQAFRGLRIDMELRSGPIACWFAQAGVGVALVDAASVAGPSYAGIVVRPFVPSPAVEVVVLHNAARPLSRTAQAFCRLFDLAWRRHLDKA